MSTSRSDKRPPQKRGRKPTFYWRELKVYVQAEVIRRQLWCETGQIPSDRAICEVMAPEGRITSLVAADLEKLGNAQRRKRIAKPVASIRRNEHVASYSRVIELKTLQNVLSKANTLAKTHPSFLSMAAAMLQVHGIDLALPIDRNLGLGWRPTPHGLPN